MTETMSETMTEAMTERSTEATTQEFDAAVFAGGAMCTAATSTLDVDAMSVGLDEIWANLSGEVERPPTSGTPEIAWNALVFSVREGQGLPGSAMAAERGRMATDPKRDSGGDLFSYVLDGSDIAVDWVDVSQRAIDRSELGLVAGDQIDAVDVHLSLYELDVLFLDTLNSRVENWRRPNLYFSLSPETVGNAPATWWASSPPSAATILIASWLGPRLGWSCPSVFLSYDDMGLRQDDDITALAVDEHDEQILFGLRLRPGRPDPLMFYSWSTAFTGGAVPYVYPGPADVAGPVSIAMGVGPCDDVTGTCDLDPTCRGQATTITRVNAYGTPLEMTPCTFPNEVSASAFRGIDPGGTPTLRTFLTGFPSGTAPPGFGIVGVNFFSFGSTPCPTLSAPAAPLLFLVARNPGTVPCGSPATFSFGLPTTAAGTNNSFTISWLAGQFGSPNFGQAYPLVIGLP